MTALRHATLQRLVHQVLTRRSESAGGAGALAAGARQAYDDLTRSAAPLIGQVGIAALTGRALHLALREHPWLIEAHAGDQRGDLFASIADCLERQDPEVARDGAAAVLVTLVGLLVTFIGEPVTTRLLQSAWPDALPGASAEEI